MFPNSVHEDLELFIAFDGNEKTFNILGLTYLFLFS